MVHTLIASPMPPRSVAMSCYRSLTLALVAEVLRSRGGCPKMRCSRPIRQQPVSAVSKNMTGSFAEPDLAQVGSLPIFHSADGKLKENRRLPRDCWVRQLRSYRPVAPRHATRLA